ncbi:28S ribosomal protein S10, mitochondrial, partial [Fragariocoptes setiger]
MNFFRHGSKFLTTLVRLPQTGTNCTIATTYDTRSLRCLSTKASEEASAPEEETDKLYKKLVIECRAHDSAVLESYDRFCRMAAEGLDIEHVKSWQPFRHIKRRTLLASRHVHKKYRVQYEWRTYYNFIEFKNLTGSTADTYLEYIERNVPEGVMLTIIKHELGTLPFDPADATTEDKNSSNPESREDKK